STTPGAGAQPAGGTPTSMTPAAAFPFQLPAAPSKNGTQALATNTKDGGVVYDVAYSLVTVSGGAPVTETNSAYALAHCRACTTVAVSFQVVLIVGRSKLIAPIDAAGSLNYDCPACTTTAIADQLVVTLKSQPSAALVAKLAAALKQLNALPKLGAGGTPAAIASAVASVQQQIQTELDNSGLPANPITTTTPSGSGTSTTSQGSVGSNSSASQPQDAQTNTTSSAPGSSAPTTSTATGSSPPPTTTPSQSSQSATTSTTTTSAAPTDQTSGTATASSATATTPAASASSSTP
ncbi:MAG: hypothetical protein WAK93_08290, partial [Solirubrobacteraceae bacterium]